MRTAGAKTIRFGGRQYEYDDDFGDIFDYSYDDVLEVNAFANFRFEVLIALPSLLSDPDRRICSCAQDVDDEYIFRPSTRPNRGFVPSIERRSYSHDDHSPPQSMHGRRKQFAKERTGIVFGDCSSIVDTVDGDGIDELMRPHDGTYTSEFDGTFISEYTSEERKMIAAALGILDSFPEAVSGFSSIALRILGNPAFSEILSFRFIRSKRKISQSGEQSVDTRDQELLKVRFFCDFPKATPKLAFEKIRTGSFFLTPSSF